MNAKISVGIVGYGNVGRGVELALRQNPDMQLAAVVTRRDPASLKLATPGVAVVRESEIASLKGKVDVLILCGGSATDLPEQGPRLAALFNTVDSFATHARIPEYFAAVDAAAGVLLQRAAGSEGIELEDPEAGADLGQLDGPLGVVDHPDRAVLVEGDGLEAPR